MNNYLVWDDYDNGYEVIYASSARDAAHEYMERNSGWDESCYIFTLEVDLDDRTEFHMVESVEYEMIEQ